LALLPVPDATAAFTSRLPNAAKAADLQQAGGLPMVPNIIRVARVVALIMVTLRSVEGCRDR
jgi:hypothetical protein